VTDPHGHLDRDHLDRDHLDHLDLDALADVLAGERDDPHLRACADCRDRLAELEAADARVTAALGALPAPPLPPGLAAELQRVVRQERQREVAAVLPLRRPARRAPTWLPAVAASAALVMAGAVGWSLLDPSFPQSGDDAASTAGGGGGADSDTSDESAAAPEAAAGLAAPRTGTATDWSDEAARAAALTRLLRSTATLDSSATAVPTGVGLDRLRDPAELAACLANLPAGDDDVLAVDYAQWAGRPAVAVVQGVEAGLVRVTVVGSGCSGADPDLLGGTVLPRP